VKVHVTLKKNCFIVLQDFRVNIVTSQLNIRHSVRYNFRIALRNTVSHCSEATKKYAQTFVRSKLTFRELDSHLKKFLWWKNEKYLRQSCSVWWQHQKRCHEWNYFSFYVMRACWYLVKSFDINGLILFTYSIWKVHMRNR
jgi:hypothetical protein